MAHCPQVRHVVTTGPDDIGPALAAFADAGVDTIAINGGDGTVAAVLTRLVCVSPFARMPHVVILPGGTANMHVQDVGVKGKLMPALERLCRYAAGEPIAVQQIVRPVLRIEPGGERPPLCGMFFGAGAIMQGIEYAHANIHSRGVREMGPGLALARAVWGIVRGDPRFYSPVSITVALDDQPEQPPQATLIVLASTLERLFLGLRPYWGTGSGRLRFSHIHDRPRRFLRTLPALLRGRGHRNATLDAGYRSHNVERISLGLDGPFTIDGEIFEARRQDGPVVISSGGEITFIRL